MKKRLLFIAIAMIIGLTAVLSCSCVGGVLGGDETVRDPDYFDEPINVTPSPDVQEPEEGGTPTRPAIPDMDTRNLERVNENDVREIDADGLHYLWYWQEEEWSWTRRKSFTLELRQPSDRQETESWDAYPHSTLDGELIYRWEIPAYGNTVYESVLKFFDGRSDRMTFRLSQHRFYMFHDVALTDGSTYNLETVYVAADGKYSDCANFQSILGEDGEAGTKDDLKILTLVYRGWLY